MAEVIEIVEREAQPVLQKKSVCSVFKIAKTLGGSYAAITEHLATSESEPSGAPFALYTQIDWERMANAGMLSQIWQLLTEKIHLEAGMPVTAGATGNGDLEATVIPAGRYVRTIHTGPYQKVGDTYKKVVAWAKNEGVTLKNCTFESYIDDPTTMPTAEVRTEVFVPLEEAHGSA